MTVLVNEPTRSGVVIALDDQVATIIIGDAEEEWYFPAAVVPDGVSVDDIVVLEGVGRGLRITGPDTLQPSVESRLGRAINQRRVSSGRD